MKLIVNVLINLKPSTTGAYLFNFPASTDGITQSIFIEKYYGVTEAPSETPAINGTELTFTIDQSVWTKDDLKALRDAYTFSVNIADAGDTRTITANMMFFVNSEFADALKAICLTDTGYLEPNSITNTVEFKNLVLSKLHR